MDNIPLLATLRYYLLDHPKIRHFEWDPATAIGGSPTFVAATVVAYLSFTLILSRFITPSLPSTVLRPISVLYNFVILILSLLMVSGVMAASIISLPLTQWICFPSKNPPRISGPLFFWAYIYYLSKPFEFIDTLLIILNKNSGRRLSFLHVYHHTVVVVMSYLWLSLPTSLIPIGITINASVHVLMYSYYLLCAIGIRPGWKKVVTRAQIVQFVIGPTSLHLMWVFHFMRGGCTGISGSLLTCLFNLHLLYLFVDFHKKNYVSKTNIAAADKQS